MNEKNVFHSDCIARNKYVQYSSTMSVRRWVFILLVLCLLVTASLLLGVTMQHFQLLSKISSSSSAEEEDGRSGRRSSTFKGRPPPAAPRSQRGNQTDVAVPEKSSDSSTNSSNSVDET